MDALVYQSFDPSLPEPIAFSGWKHHIGYIASSVKSLALSASDDSIRTLCQGIGGSVLDLYIGKLTSEEISKEIIEALKFKGVVNKDCFKQWIFNSGTHFQQLTISDGSSWTLRWGRYPERFVHIHPSRNAIHTLRAKPGALKSVIAYCIKHPKEWHSIDIHKLNQVRVQYANLSPLKEGVVNHQIFRILRYVNM